MTKPAFSLLIILLICLLLPSAAYAQTYSFSVPDEVVNVYWKEDGSVAIDYEFTFLNGAYASPIDYIDVGVPNSNYDLSSVLADVNGNPVNDISKSPYVDPGIAIGLGIYSIQPAKTGKVHIYIGNVTNVLRIDSSDSTYASAAFSPTWFDSSFVNGSSNITVIYHFPSGVQPDEPRWHEAPSGWESTPLTGFDDRGRITYTWNNPNASASEQYIFGASFPKSYVPDSAVKNPSIFEVLGLSGETIAVYTMCCGVGGFILGIPILSYIGNQKRKLKYFPPKVSIEGHGIKRGLTAIESATLLEEPLDKIMTMILFAVIKKGAAKVITRDPLKLEIIEPKPEGLNTYEEEFLSAFKLEKPEDRKKALQDMMINLVKSVSLKMKGFSRKETIAYYRDIVKRAWAQVEAAETPEVKSQKYDEVMEWTMLDRDYERKTQDVFRTGPVFVPTWWGRYDPTFSRPATTAFPASHIPSGGSLSLPHLPGSDFAASIVKGVQSVSGNVIGNVSDFTSKITSKTNPIPVSTSSRSYSGRSGGSSGGCACACACACAGCACACAGGGR
ncbi:MAG: hypothetical protein GYA34_12155 [Chloroflexi bacterium]|nr:hypothetical protein [Chloroflexota bacterium]